MNARAWILPAAVAAWAVWSFTPLLGGYFLSDDFVPLVLFDRWQAEGRLGMHVLEKLWSGLDAGANHFYRPIPYASFALSYAASGIEPLPWMLLDVAMHVASGTLVALVALRAGTERIDARSAACATAGAAVFLFMPAGVEVVAWISGRFDGFATLFTLAACERFLASRKRWDGAWILSLVAAAAAMMSKESAAILPFAIALLAWMRIGDGTVSGARRRAAAALAVAWPWIALALAYLLLRRAIFGSVLTVYAGSSPMSAALSGAFWVRIAEALPAWLASIFDSPRLFPAACALAFAHMMIAIAGWPAQARGRRALLATAAIVGLTVLLFLPAVAFLKPNGIGGRLLHQTVAFYGVFIAVTLMTVRTRRVAWVAAATLLATLGAMQQALLERWREAHVQARALAGEVARAAAQVPAGGFALVIAPGSFYTVPFARNAQAGLMLPPIQRETLSRRLLVQLDEELPELAAKLAEGVVPTLARGTVYDFVEGRRTKTDPVEYPTLVWCWNRHEARLARLDAGAAQTPAQFAQSVQRAHEASPCGAAVAPR